MFDIKSYLELKQIEYKSSGKNVARNQYNICCQNCGEQNFHLGISSQKELFGCWKCSFSGNIKSLIKKIEKCGWLQAEKIYKQFQLDADIIYEEKEIKPINKLILPVNFTDVFPQIYKDYLSKRRFNFLQVKKKYDILCSGNYGDFKYRIIIPIFENGKIVNYIGRSIIEGADLRYKFCPDSKAVVKRKDLIYNLDNVYGNTAIIVEGAFGVWRMGDNTISFLSSNFTQSQILKLKNKNLKKIYIMFDPDKTGREKAEKLENYLTFCDVYNIELGGERDMDMDKMSDLEVLELRRKIF